MSVIGHTHMHVGVFACAVHPCGLPFLLFLFRQMLLSPPVGPPPPPLALFFMLISGFPNYGPGQYPTAQQHIEWVILTPQDYTDPPTQQTISDGSLHGGRSILGTSWASDK